MEKISALIDKLQELKNSNAGLQTISYYTQLLQAEILHQRNVQKQQELRGNGHVAVIMPAHAPVLEKPAPAPPPPAADVAAPATETAPPETPQPAPEQAPFSPAATPPERTFSAPAATTQVVPPEKTPVAAPPSPASNGHGNGYAPDRVPVKEKPVAATLFDPPPPQKTGHDNGNIRQELNELVGKHAPSLNDSLRSAGNVELGEKLGGLGVNDLKNAIGINDKFQFIQELFRGDKTMYERSIKTINESTSLQEAVYWIERELKIKLGWNENDQLVQHFYLLVRKRFS
ncbi:hypothetical protein [Chitinophaga alhagiae]|uniref:hypothetical protein n=1 Tax=Chitinophaga alhagiae TaxID=2203219 RepID=UPI000E5B453E|nr:hypothetical protein [Chitinophaga alhagiae]